MISILIGGPAGKGVRSASRILSKIIHNYGYYVFNYRDYQSLIQGGHNFDIVTISENPVYSYENKFDIIAAIDKRTLKIHEKNLKKNGIIISADVLNIKKDKNIKLLFYIIKLLGIPEKIL